MKKLFTLFTITAFALSIAMVDAADDKKKKRDPNAERTFKGTVKCAKCSLKKTEACQAALEITRKNKDGKEFNSNVKGSFSYLTKLLEIADTLIGKDATIKYFNLTPDGVPRFPYVIAIRDYE